ncbi:MAG: sugar phosphate nucleotidyltransferase [Candidatus Omnitrophota bacterium]
MNNIDTFLITEDASLKDAMKRMDKVGAKNLFVVDADGKLLGALTDGDIRRWILKGGDIKEGLENVYNRSPHFVTRNYDKNDVKKIMLKHKIERIPVACNDKKIVDVLFWENIFGEERFVSKNKLAMPVVIMAGGRGTRLDPFTRILPKPLIPIGEKTIIDIIMDKFAKYGIKDFYVTINHKAKMIKSYFEETQPPYNISYLEEDLPLGTAGSLKFLEGKIEESVIVSNCDIIVDCDYTEVTEFHNKNGYDITIVGSFRHFTIPYGICEIEKDGLLKTMTEKPEYDFLVNTGMSVLRKNVLNLIPENKKFHITDLVKCVKEKGGKVGVFPINAKSWIDVGEWEEYRKSVRIMGLEG